jgi:hypothetical protein
MSDLHDDFPQCAQAREEARLAEEAKARAELRDRFAMAALSGVLANPENDSFEHEAFAIEAYRYADAMLKARDK